MNSEKAEGETWVKSFSATEQAWFVVIPGVRVICQTSEAVADRIIADHQQAQRLEQAVDALREIASLPGTAAAGRLNGIERARNISRAALAALTPPAEQPGGTR